MNEDLGGVVTELIEDKWGGHTFDEMAANRGPEMGCSICYFIQRFARAGVRIAVMRVNATLAPSSAVVEGEGS